MDTDLIRVLASVTALVELLVAKDVIGAGELQDTVNRHMATIRNHVPDET